ncbi:MAG: hypothetical protein FJ276_07255, partial [Planctomycetes bacterium]|nr:hypothetical protein [Planctomycetota bacterium]
MSPSVLDSPVRSAAQPRANTAARDSLPAAQPALAGPPLGRRLMAAGLLTDSELQAALEHQAKNGSKLGESLLELGLVTEEQLLPFLRRQRGLPASRGDRVLARVVDRKRRTFNLDGLGLPGDLLTQVKRLLTKPYGL